ncbi:MAG TPA: ATP-binding protein, partial [Spirochaetales bacterium]|nr:ATP-binding protein [Spirochaetales bacterium]
MFKALTNLYWLARGVRVFALVGGSGTGKSFRAKLVAQKFGIDMIIDDGLLISGDAIVAGKSAKREKLYMAAVKTALFHEKAHRDEVARVLQKTRWKKILIIGTSEKMTMKIAERLQIPYPAKTI